MIEWNRLVLMMGLQTMKGVVFMRLFFGLLMFALLLVPNAALADSDPPMPVCDEGVADCTVLYLPNIGPSDWVRVSFRHVSCTGVPLAGQEVEIDPFDGLPGYLFLTDANGIATWEGRTNTFMRFVSIASLVSKTFVATAYMPVEVQYCSEPGGITWTVPYE